MKHSSMVWFLLAGLVLMVGCGSDEESYTRYPSVRIPEFTSDDYVVHLSSEDPEVIYNAVCNLGNSARKMGGSLWGDKADPESDEWKAAQQVYTNICIQLQSEVPMTVAASLRFLQLFVGSHEARSELIDPVCRINSSSVLVQFEQVALLKRLVDDTTTVPEPLLRRLLESKSWIVSRSTYGLVGELSNESLRSDLLARYRSDNDEAERLLLLAAYGNSSEPEVIEFMMNEMLATDRPKIRHAAFFSLMNNIETPLVQAWIIEHSAEFEPDEQGWIFNAAGEMDNDEAGLKLVHEMLNCGYEPEDKFLLEYIEMDYIFKASLSGELSEELELSEEEIEECKVLCASMEKILQENRVVAARLNELREREAQKRAQCQALEAEFGPLVDEFMEKAGIVLSQHAVSDEEQEKFLKPITGLNYTSLIPAASP